MDQYHKPLIKAAMAAVLMLQGLLALGQNNYIRIRSPRTAISSSTVMDSYTGNKDSISVSFQYLDGLGRLLQTVQQQGSPAGNDIIQPYVYDQFGRDSVKYLPYTLNAAVPGAYQPNALSGSGGYTGSQQYQFYQQGGPAYVNTTAPYAATGFEPSPLSRTLEQGAAGISWQLSTSGITGSGHTVKMDYASNDQSTFNGATLTNNPGSRMAALYTATVNSDGTRTLARANNNAAYATGQLFLTISKDENWNAAADGCLGTTEEYRDLEGHVVLKRTYNLKNGALEMLSTYYVYDDFGLLAFVLPPAANPDAAVALSQATLNNLCYQYGYDERGRMITRQLPGKGIQELVYNLLDQVIFDRDANQAGLSEWGFTKYDAQGRVIMTGVEKSNTSTRPALQSYVDNSLMAQSFAEWETPAASGGVQGYSNSCFPNSSYIVPLVVNYYDNYGFAGAPATAVAPAGASVLVKGTLTAAKTAVLNTMNNTVPDMLWDVHYYDDLGRASQSYAQHYLGGILSAYNYDAVTSAYNFTNQVTGTVRQHYGANSGNTAATLNATIANTYVYDQLGRRLQTFEQLNGGASVLLAQNQYNELGQLYVKSLHGLNAQGLPANVALGAANALAAGQSQTVQAANSIVLNPGFGVAGGGTLQATVIPYLQSITYAYNERGWLLGSSAPLFAMQLQYNQVSGVTGIAPAAQYNGNIASQSWGTAAAPNSKSYLYSYDRLNRLAAGTATDNNNETGMVYDQAGNLTALNRYQAGTLIDQLSYSYTNGGNYTNQVQSIADGSGSNAGLVSGTMAYSYDANGNLLTNSNSANNTQNKSFAYNLLNLPQTVTLPAGTVTYTYDAAGQKLRKVAVINGTTTATDYISGIQYSNSAIAFIQTDEGKAVPVSGGFDYTYYLGDNLGNTRITFDTQTGTAALQQQDDYYPFGMEINRLTTSPKNEYLYNKKELQEELGQLDYGARFYDPVIGRWNVIDPKAELGRRWSPYSYGSDNSICRIDPDGMLDQYFDQSGNYLGQDERGDNGRVRIITNSSEISTVKANNNAGQITNSNTVNSGVATTKAVLKEALNVLDRTNDSPNNGVKEEMSVVGSNGELTRATPGSEKTETVSGEEVATNKANLPIGGRNTFIHSHTTALETMSNGEQGSGNAEEPGPADAAAFKNYSLNIIVGNLGFPTKGTDSSGKKTLSMPAQGAVFYDNKAKPQAKVEKSALQTIANSK